jgi:hypothetical protein
MSTAELDPQTDKMLERVRAELAGWAFGQYVRPSVLAARAHVPPQYAVPLLKLLEVEGHGQLGVTIVDDDHLELGFWHDVTELPPRLEDEMGQVYEPSPANVEVRFRRGQLNE